MSLSQSRRAIEARQWRATKREKRRFNIVLSDFTKTKFGNVYSEAKEFFESLNEKYPNKHDLTKTKEYKLWKNNIVNDDTDGSEKETEDKSDSEREPEVAGEQSVNEKQPGTPGDKSASEADDEADETDNALDILQIAVQDLPVSPEINDLDARIEQIIQELQQDNNLRDFLNDERNGELVHPRYEDDDEGIGLNVEVELEAVFEPFDYELEVEGADW